MLVLASGFNGREGLVLYDLGYADGDQAGRRRPVLHRASIGEMCVPYADPRWAVKKNMHMLGMLVVTTMGCCVLGCVCAASRVEWCFAHTSDNSHLEE